MDPWIVGLVVLVVVGLGAIVFGALHDRSRNRRRAAQLLAPPDRSIPSLAADAPAPHYVSELQARQRTTSLRPLPASERQLISAQLAGSATMISSGYASKDFRTDPEAGWAVLDSPRVLVCDDEVGSIRELLPTLEKLITTKTPLVIVAPAIGPSVRATLEVNAIRGTMALLVVLVPDHGERRRIAERSGAVVVDRSDRQSGYLPPEQLGHVDRWVSTNRESYLIASAPDQVG